MIPLDREDDPAFFGRGWILCEAGNKKPDNMKAGAERERVRLVKRIVIVMMLCLPSLAYGDPSIEFVREAHDFGHVEQGEQLEYTFDFSNTGTEELIIERIETS